MSCSSGLAFCWLLSMLTGTWDGYSVLFAIRLTPWDMPGVGNRNKPRVGISFNFV